MSCPLSTFQSKGRGLQASARQGSAAGIYTGAHENSLREELPPAPEKEKFWEKNSPNLHPEPPVLLPHLPFTDFQEYDYTRDPSTMCWLLVPLLFISAFPHNFWRCPICLSLLSNNLQLCALPQCQRHSQPVLSSCQLHQPSSITAPEPLLSCHSPPQPGVTGVSWTPWWCMKNFHHKEPQICTSFKAVDSYLHPLGQLNNLEHERTFNVRDSQSSSFLFTKHRLLGNGELVVLTEYHPTSTKLLYTVKHHQIDASL